MKPHIFYSPLPSLDDEVHLLKIEGRPVRQWAGVETDVRVITSDLVSINKLDKSCSNKLVTS